jgi:hypothetical protein
MRLRLLLRLIRTAGYTAPIRDAWRFTNLSNGFCNLLVTANRRDDGVGAARQRRRSAKTVQGATADEDAHVVR